MPAAAVIPAPRAYIKVVAVKKLVVELEILPNDSTFINLLLIVQRILFLLGNFCVFYWMHLGSRTVTLKKLERLKQAFA